MNDRFLIAGASGQLGQTFAGVLSKRGYGVEAPPEGTFDITSEGAVARAIADYRPTVLLNCAAYNNVDGAEGDPATAYRVNRDAVSILAGACAAADIRFVHYGTDYVFDGETQTPNTEASPTNPLSVYGKSKLAGEDAALEIDQSLVLRCSWVYGPGPQNFLHKLRQWSQGRDRLQVVSDQISTPTYTVDIAEATLEALAIGLTGRYHLVNGGFAPRNEVARVFFDLIGIDIAIDPVPTSHFPSPAQRPRFSALSAEKLATALGHALPDWRDALARFCRSASA